jgi:hypothetical protein
MRRLRFLLRPARIEQEAGERVEAGMSPEQARHTTCADFGSIAACKEDVREAAGLRLWMDLKRDVIYAIHHFLLCCGPGNGISLVA